MNATYLFSHKVKWIGWVLLSIGLVIGIVLVSSDYDFPSWNSKVYPLIGSHDIFSSTPFSWTENNISDEIASILVIVGGILVAFSKTKDEDEYIASIRMASLTWATYVNYAILLVSIVFVFDIDFFNVLIFNMFTILLFFIIRFHYILYKNKKLSQDE